MAHAGRASIARLSFDPVQAMDAWRSFHLNAMPAPSVAMVNVETGPRLEANAEGYFEWSDLRETCADFEDERWVSLRTSSTVGKPERARAVPAGTVCFIHPAIGADRHGPTMLVPSEAPHLALRSGAFACGAMEIEAAALRRLLDAAPAFLRGTDVHLDTLALLARRTVAVGTPLAEPAYLPANARSSAPPAQLARVFDTLATPDFVALARTSANIELSRSASGVRKSLGNLERHLRHLHRRSVPPRRHERLRRGFEWLFSRVVAPAEETELENFGRYYDGEFVEGYVFDPDGPDRHYEVSLVVNGRVSSSMTARLVRSDLARRGHGDGSYGYRFDVSDLARPGLPVCIHVRIDVTGHRIRNSLRAVTARSAVAAAAERMRRRFDRIVYDL